MSVNCVLREAEQGKTTQEVVHGRFSEQVILIGNLGVIQKCVIFLMEEKYATSASQPPKTGKIEILAKDEKKRMAPSCNFF